MIMKEQKQSKDWYISTTLSILVAIVVGISVVIAATLVTFILPESYASSTKIKVQIPAGSLQTSATAYDASFFETQAHVVASESVLAKVSEDLKLPSEWGKKYAQGERLATAEVIAILRKHLEARPIRNTTLLEIRVFSESPAEAADLANRIVEAYQAFGAMQTPKIEAEVIDRAVPGLRPVRPNKPLNIGIGILAGGLFGSLMGRLTFLLRRRSNRRKTTAGIL